MFVSVVISAYNGRNYIERCVNSYLAQSFPDFELILVDDASTDTTRSIIQALEKAHPDKIRAVCSDVNLGPGGGKELGRTYAQGVYVNFADCDDYVTPDFLAKLVEASRENDFPDIVIGGFKSISVSGKILYERSYPNADSALYSSISDWGKLIKREFIERNDLHIPAGRGVLDDVLFQSTVIVSAPTYSVVEDMGYFYVQNSSSISNTLMNHFSAGVLEKEIKYLYDFFTRLNDPDSKDLCTYFAFRMVCWHLLKSGCGVPKEEMLQEYENAFCYLDRYFPEYRVNRNISWFRPRNERGIIRFAVGTVSFLHRIHLAKLFFLTYSQCKFLKKLWPNM